MAEFRRIVEQGKQFWTQLGNKQRLLLAGGGVLTLVTLLFFVRQVSTPEYKVLFNGLEPGDAQSLAAQLTEKNIPHQISQDGKSISVQSDKLDSARLEVASQGMPHSGRMGFELFDKLSWGQTEFDEKVTYQRALEGELERTIQQLNDVESARVHLVLPTDSVFIDRQRSAKASVILKLRRGNLSPARQLTISRLVAGAVDELAPENVSVIDANTNLPLSGSGRDSKAGISIEQDLSSRLVATLEPILGSERIRATVNVEYDPSVVEESQEKYDPNSTVALTVQKSEERTGSGSSLGVPGTTSNIPGSAPATATKVGVDDGSQVSKSDSETYAVNRVVRHTSEPAGRIRRISAAVVVDDATETSERGDKRTERRRKRTAEEMQQIQQLAQAAIGIDSARGDVISVQNISFDSPSIEPMPTPGRVQRIRTVLTDWSSLVRYAVIFLLFLTAYLLLLRPIKKQALRTLKELHSQKNDSQPTVVATEAVDLLSASALGEAPQRALVLKKHVLEKVKQEPTTSSRLVQAWLYEENQ